jgi:hypothetical protein
MMQRTAKNIPKKQRISLSEKIICTPIARNFTKLNISSSPIIFSVSIGKDVTAKQKFRVDV